MLHLPLSPLSLAFIYILAKIILFHATQQTLSNEVCITSSAEKTNTGGPVMTEPQVTKPETSLTAVTLATPLQKHSVKCY